MRPWWCIGLLALACCGAPAAEDGRFSVADYGAVGDGETCDSGAFQAALDAAAPVGGWVYVPPLPKGRGYVLTQGLTVPEGVAVIGAPGGVGSPVRAVFDLPENTVVGAKIYARPAPDEYAGPGKTPLFNLLAGATVRGLWILYDEQPLPSDEAFQDPASPFHYPDYATARQGFVKDHVRHYGPTFYAAMGVNIVVEDIVCDRCWDFLYFKQSGKCHVERVALYPYNKGFVFEYAPDVLHLDNVEWVPNGGPTSPGGPYGGKTYTWAYGILVTREDHVGIHLGQVDGYSFSDVTFFSLHTGVRFGHSPRYPMVNPVTGETVPPLKPGTGPWGDFTALRTDQCVIGMHLVWPTHLTNRIGNALVFTAYDDGADFDAAAGPGELAGVARQGAIVVEDTHTRANNAGYVATCMVNNLVVASFNDRGRFGPAAANVLEAGGRALLLGGDVFLELSGFQVNAPYHEGLLWAAGPAADHYRVRARGVIVGFEPVADLDLAPMEETAESQVGIGLPAGWRGTGRAVQMR